jgi:hypothetical protein
MSASSIDKKINIANSKVAKQLGVVYNVYRPLAFTAPISLQNWTAEQKASFTLDEKFSKSQTSKFDMYKCYTDAALIEPGDIFVNDDSTYVIINKELLQPVQAFRSNRTITVTRAGYSTTGGTFGKTETAVITDVPSNVQYGVTGDLNSMPAASTNKSNVPIFEIRVWAPDGTIELNDIVVDSQGNRSVVHAAQWSPLGYVLKTQELKKAA